ncbi:MAG TPA: hypothetical protein VLF79_02950 [Candidatus Saccharimonadales bacterium]|nr:hypothetical protein [Candidatus Saccharimonadales bacterium]
MSEFFIEIGATKYLSCIGIKPPVDPELREEILDHIDREDELEAVGNGRDLTTLKLPNGEEYSELALKSKEDDFRGQRINRIVLEMRRLIEEADPENNVFFDPEIKNLNTDQYLFVGPGK